jgi:hypothetical protein
MIKKIFSINRRYISYNFYLILKSEIKSNYKFRCNRYIGYNLYNILNKKLREKYFLKTSNNLDNFEDNDWLIIRDINSFQQKNIIINQKKNIDNFVENDNIIITKLLLNPDLIDGYKYHFRVFYLLRNTKEIYLYKYFRIFSSSQKFDINNLNYDNIITARPFSQNKSLYFPNNLSKYTLNDIEYITNQMCEIGKEILKIINYNYNNNSDWFQILGADFMINDKMEIKIAEINNKQPGFLIDENNNDDNFYFNDFINNVKNVLLYDIPLNNNFIKIEWHKKLCFLTTELILYKN